MKMKNKFYWSQQHPYFVDLPYHDKLKAARALSLFYLGMMLLSVMFINSMFQGVSLTSFLSIYILFLAAYSIDIFAIFNKYIRKNYNLLAIISLLLVMVAMGYAVINEVDHANYPGFNLLIYFAFIGSVTFLSAGLTKYGELLYNNVSEKTRIATEIELASNIQKKLVPEINLETVHYNIIGKTLPAKEIGGDYFDYLNLGDEKIAVMIGDVSGHNLPAGVLMAITKSAIRTELKYNSDTEKIAASLNDTICENSEKNMFVSFCLCIFDTKNKTYEILNAGHLPIIKSSNSSIVKIKTPNIAMGLKPGAKFTSETGKFDTGDKFIMLTDGITERMNEKNDEYGFVNLEKVIQNHGDGKTDKLFEDIFKDVSSFGGKTELSDDATLLIVEVK